MRYAIPDITRFPQGQDFVSSCRLGKCATESAGKRSATSGAKLGHAYLKGAFSEAAVRLLRTKAMGHKYLARLENKPGKGQALTILAPQRARAGSYLLKRDTGFARPKFLHG